MKKVIKIILVCVLIVATLGVVPLLIASSSSGSGSTMKAGKGIEIENKVVSIDDDTAATLSECYERIRSCEELLEYTHHQVVFENNPDIWCLQQAMSKVEETLDSVYTSLNTSVYPDLGFAKADIESLKSALSSLTNTVQNNRSYMDYLKNYISEESYLDLSTASDTLAHRLYTLEMSIPVDCSSDVSDLKNRVSALESSQSSGSSSQSQNENFFRIINNPGGKIYYEGSDITDYSSIIIYDPDNDRRMSAPTVTIYVMFQPGGNSDWFCGYLDFELYVGGSHSFSSGVFGILSFDIIDKQTLSDGYVEYSVVGFPFTEDMIISASVSPCEEY